MAITPTLTVEEELWASGVTRVCGVDEVGIGAWVGCCVACAVILPPNCALIPGVRDSKTMSATRRARLAVEIRKQAISVGLGAASVAEIDRLNVFAASHLAMRRALQRVRPYDHAIIDGRAFHDPTLGHYSTIVDGDATSYSIACASIIAKETRDALLKRLAKRYPSYGWERNAGYGSKEHIAALQTYGVTPYHRRSYAPIRAILERSAGNVSAS